MPYSFPEISARIAPIAEKYRIPAVYLFGSYARGESSESSDIDVLVSREGSTIRSAFDMGALYAELRDALGVDIDLVTLESLSAASSEDRRTGFFTAVDNEKVLVYGQR